MSWGQDPETALRPLDLGDVLDGTFQLARKHWRAFTIGLGILAVPAALLPTLALAGTIGPSPGIRELLADPAAAGLAAEPTMEQVGGLLVSLGVSLVIGLLVAPLAYGTAVAIAAAAYRTGRADGVERLKAAGRRYLGLVGVVVLQGLIPLVAIVTPAILVVIAGTIDAVAIAVVGGVGVLVGIVFAVIATVRIALAIPALFVEGVGPLRALSRSNELVTGRTGGLLGGLVVVFIITSIIGGVLTIPFSFLGTFIGDAAGLVLNTVGSMVSSVVSNALIGAALVLYYFDRRVRTEGYDLAQLADELGGGHSAAGGTDDGLATG